MSSFPYLLAITVLMGSAVEGQNAAMACHEWQQCREHAIDAAGREDFEAFHDLAWRTVQRGPNNDPALMYLLARAQSLSGRPSDAMVMLSRLVDMGIAPDAGTSADFRRVRALSNWPALEVRIAAVRAPAVVAEAPTIEAAPRPSVEPQKTIARRLSPAPAPAPARSPASATPAVVDPLPAAAPSSPPGSAETTATDAEAVRFAGAGTIPIALAYDAVSRRFIVANPHARTLAVVDEFSQHVATLSGAQAAFADIAAIEIDPIEGHLWVVSSESIGAVPATTLHKLQLISGRVLWAFPLLEAFAPGRFVDVAIAPDRRVLALDAMGGRVFALRAGSTTLELASTLRQAEAPSSVAPAGGSIAYVAHRRGVLRVDLVTGDSAPVNYPPTIALDGLVRLRWYRGSLIGTQDSDGGSRAVRLTLDRAGRRITSLTALGPVSMSEPTAAAIAGDTLYYFGARQSREVSVRRVRLQR